jgi:hypothetical protein
MTSLPKTYQFAGIVLLIFASTLPSTTIATETSHLKSQYAGQQTRLIKSLSQDDIQQLTEGKGWGLAKAAELNGVPGPAHLLEMKQEIELSDTQVKKIQQLFDHMKSQAQELGKELIRLEADLNQEFVDRSINKDSLRTKLSAIEKVRRDLRYVHLATHLETPSILSVEQITKYNKLRGYNNDDPCTNIPKGHDKTMWLKHNGCLAK